MHLYNISFANILVTRDETICVIITFILAMLHCPAVYKRLQEEIDAVATSHRNFRLIPKHDSTYKKLLHGFWLLMNRKEPAEEVKRRIDSVVALAPGRAA